MKPTIHVIAPFHTIPNDEFSHCAFTGKARRFSAMMKPFGYTLIEYANRGSDSAADVKRVMLNEEEFHTHFKPETSSPGAQATIGTPGWRLFDLRVAQALRELAKPGDLVAHIWTAHESLVHQFPGLIHVETGIGYPNNAIGAYRVFESEAWRHYHWGRVGTPGGVLPTNRIDMNPARTWVIPNYFDSADWPLVETPQNYVVFMSRFVVDKGIDMLRKVIKAWVKKHPDDDTKFALAGMGGYAEWLASSDFSEAEKARIDYRGIVLGKDRAAFVGNAKLMLLPSIFVEPFGGAAVEAALCGTPAATPTFGAFTETIQHGRTGFRCRTVEDYVTAIEQVSSISRGYTSRRAVDRYSLGACGALYDEVFRTLTERASAE